MWENTFIMFVFTNLKSSEKTGLKHQNHYSMWTFPNVLVLSFHVALDVTGRISSLSGYLKHFCDFNPLESLVRPT